MQEGCHIHHLDGVEEGWGTKEAEKLKEAEIR